MHKYTPKEIRFLERKIAGRSYSELTELFNKHFGVSLTVGQITGQLKYHRLHNGIRYFYPGHPPFFKGKNKTSYKPGQKPWNYIPIGAERVNFNGIVDVKVAETPPKKWKSKHLIIWEQANGPIPKGCQIIFADRNKRNFELSNLLLVSRKEIAVMNKNRMVCGVAELTKTAKLLADVKIRMSERKRGIKNAAK